MLGFGVCPSARPFATGRPRRPTIQAMWSRRCLRTRSATRRGVAYRRGDLFEKRAVLMGDWGAFPGAPTTEIVLLAGKRGEHAEVLT